MRLGVNAVDYYILDGQGRPVLETDDRRWSYWHDVDSRRFIAQDHWRTSDGCLYVETNFLGFSDTNPPLLWQTLATLHRKNGDLPEPIDHCDWLYLSRAEAVKGHQEMVRRLTTHDHFPGRGGTYGVLFAAIGLRLLDYLADGRLDWSFQVVRRCMRW